jgi:ABC-type antimicrobial peptide transport system permease subunit
MAARDDGDPSLSGNVSLVIRTSTPPETVAEAVRAAVWELDPNVPITHVLTLEKMVSDARAPMAFSMLLLLVSAALALALGAIGVYGVVSFVVSRRTQEIGVRMALGAERGQVRVMVLRDGLGVVLPGVAIDLVGALSLSRLMKSLLYQVSPLDPLTFAVVPLVLVAVALLASLVPAARASRVDPAVPLRLE